MLVIDGMLGEDGTHQLNIHPRTRACRGVELGESLGSEIATGETNEAATVLRPPCAGGAQQVVHRWTAPEAGRYDINTFGSQYDTVLFILDDQCSDDVVGCNDDDGGLQSRLVVDVDAGQTLTIVVAGFQGRAGRYRLNIRPHSDEESPACPDEHIEGTSGVLFAGLRPVDTHASQGPVVVMEPTIRSTGPLLSKMSISYTPGTRMGTPFFMLVQRVKVRKQPARITTSDSEPSPDCSWSWMKAKT